MDIEIVPPFSTTATFGFASGYTEVLQGGTISMPNDFIPGLKTKTNF
jgi:hypothetical protein